MTKFDSFMNALTISTVLGITLLSTIATFKIYTNLPAMTPVFIVQQWIIYVAVALTFTTCLMFVAAFAYFHKVIEIRAIKKAIKQQSIKNKGE